MRWRSHPHLSRALRALVVALPIVASVGAAIAVSRRLADPDGVRSTLVWWATLIGVTLLVMTVTRRAMNRLLPLSMLLKLSLVFPDRVPSRFRVALRGWSPKRLAARLDPAEFDPDGTPPAETVELLLASVAALNAHDPTTRGHSERTRAYAELLGRELGLGDDDLERLRWVALLHDVGKLRVPKSVLTKDRAPDPIEWKLLRRHPEAGYDLTRPLHDYLGAWAETILHHHERYDGSGYPFGLAGEQISLGARIVAVADAYDAMTAVRTYQPALSADTARREIAALAGTQFDPTVVRALLNISVGKVGWIAGPVAILAQLPFTGGLRRAGHGASTVAAGAAALVAVAVGGFVGPASDPQPSVMGNRIEAPVAVGPATRLEAPVVEIQVGDGSGDVEITVPPAAGDATVEGASILYTVPSGAEGEASIGYRVCEDDTCRDESVTVELTGDTEPLVTAAPAGVRVKGARQVQPTLSADPAPTTTTTSTAMATTGTSTTSSTSSTTTAPAVTTTTTTEPPPATTTTAPPTTTTEPPPATTTAPPTTTTTAPPTTTTTAPPTTTTAPPTTTTAPPTTTTAPPTTTTAPASVVAVDDDAATEPDTAVTIDVLANDTVDAGATVALDKNPNHGTVDLAGTMITYTPDPGFTGTDNFAYEVCNPGGPCATARVRIEIDG